MQPISGRRIVRLKLQIHLQTVARIVMVSQMKMAEAKTLPGAIVARVDFQSGSPVSVSPVTFRWQLRSVR